MEDNEMLNTKTSVEVIYHIARMLNNEIETNGELQINNSKIWDGYLHQMDNETWTGVLVTLKQLNLDHPKLFKLYHSDAIDDALEAIIKFGDYYDSVLDMRNRHVNHKTLAWKCLMTIREVYNNACNIHLDNSDASKVKSTYRSLFE